MGAEANGGQVFVLIDAAGGGYGLLEDVMHAAQGEHLVEKVGEQFGHAAKRAVADESETEDRLPQPGLGDWEPDEELGGSVEGRAEAWSRVSCT
jgi:hypothetical protein